MTKRTANSRNGRKISPAAIAAWQAGDRRGVVFALGIRPWQVHPFDVDGASLPPDYGTAWAQDYPQILELRKEMIRLAGPPPTTEKESA